jgi:fumarate hydratase class II
MSDYRIEKDSLGEVRVPAGAYWGAQTQRAIHNFPITGLKPYPAFVWAMAMIKRAAAEVNAGLGSVQRTQGRRPAHFRRRHCPGGDGGGRRSD